MGPFARRIFVRLRPVMVATSAGRLKLAGPRQRWQALPGSSITLQWRLPSPGDWRVQPDLGASGSAAQGPWPMKASLFPPSAWSSQSSQRCCPCSLRSRPGSARGQDTLNMSGSPIRSLGLVPACPALPGSQPESRVPKGATVRPAARYLATMARLIKVPATTGSKLWFTVCI